MSHSLVENIMYRVSTSNNSVYTDIGDVVEEIVNEITHINVSQIDVTDIYNDLTSVIHSTIVMKDQTVIDMVIASVVTWLIYHNRWMLEELYDDIIEEEDLLIDLVPMYVISFDETYKLERAIIKHMLNHRDMYDITMFYTDKLYIISYIPLDVTVTDGVCVIGVLSVCK